MKSNGLALSLALGCGLASAPSAQASGALWNPTQVAWTIIPRIPEDSPSTFRLTITDPAKPDQKPKEIPVDPLFSEALFTTLPPGHLLEVRVAETGERVPSAVFEVAYDHLEADKRLSFTVKYASIINQGTRFLETMTVVEAPPAGQGAFRMQPLHPSVLILLESRAKVPKRRTLPAAVSSRLDEEEKKGRLEDIAEASSEEESPLPRPARSSGWPCCGTAVD
jgi:hypothetical protein